MWTLDTPWYELVIRTVSIFVFVFLICRLWGKKHLGEIAAFDFILLLIISEAVQNSLVDDDHSIPGGMIVITTLIVMNTILSKTTFHSRKLEKLIDGVPRVLISDGKLNRQLLDDEAITEQELYEALRQEGVMEISDVKQATIETNGTISVIKKEPMKVLLTFLADKLKSKGSNIH